MQELHFWCPLSVRWWQTWKAYTRYEELEDAGVAAFSLNDDVTPSPPGAIDNSDLLGPEPDELKQGLVEGEDFVLLPAGAYEVLEEWHGGGPKFKRVVVAHGNRKPPTLLVELYPVRCRTYRCLPSGLPDMLSCRSELMSRSRTLDQVQSILLNSLSIPHENARIFVKVLEPAADSLPAERDSWVMVEDTATFPAAAPEAASGSGGSVSNGGSGGISQTEEDEDDTDGWKAVDINNSNRTLDEMLGGTQGVVNLLLDVRESGSDPYPREKILQRWRNRLEVGDLVDARDQDSDWLEARVVSCEPSGEVIVHFLGWAAKWDLKVKVTDPWLQRLHTHTMNWRSLLTPGYQLEVREGKPEDSEKWMKGKVVEVFPEHQDVIVEFSSESGVPTGERRRLAIYGDDVNCLGTHLKEGGKAAGGTVQRGSGAAASATSAPGHMAGAAAQEPDGVGADLRCSKVAKAAASESAAAPAAAAKEQRWRELMKVGNMVDAMDSYNKWCEARVVSSEPSGEIVVHFLGWSAKWDMKVKATDPRLQRLHTNTVNWRALITPGYKLEVRKEHNTNWFTGKIVKVFPGHDDMIVEFNSECGKPTGEHRKLAIFGDDVSCLGTHIRNYGKAAAGGMPVQTRWGAAQEPVSADPRCSNLPKAAASDPAAALAAASREETRRWRNTLKAGDLVDARDTDNSWLEARVVSCEPSGVIDVHFLGWAAKWDMKMEVTDPRLQPLHTHTVKWRSLLTPGYKLEVREEKNRKWLEGKVVTVFPEHQDVIVEFYTENWEPSGERRRLAIYGDDINRLGTHIKTYGEAAASKVQTRSGSRSA